MSCPSRIRLRVPEFDVGSRYRPLWLHASGGLGAIFAATRYRVASPGGPQADAARRTQRTLRAANGFVAEAEITGKLEHPGIVPVYGLGAGPDGLPYYAMRFVKGETLSTAIHRFHSGLDVDFTGREFRWLLRRFMDACNPVAYAHSRGILHRDLKPSNIMLGPFGETLVMDWGVAKVISVAEPGETLTDDTPTRTAGTGCAPRIGQRRDDAGRSNGRHAGLHEPGAGCRAAGRAGTGRATSTAWGQRFTCCSRTSGRSAARLNRFSWTCSTGSFCRPAPSGSRRCPRALEAICLRAMALEPGNRYDVGACNSPRISSAGWPTSR